MIRLVFLLTTLVIGAAPAADRQPILAVTQSTPWASVIGSDSASFVLYDDGLLISLSSDPRPESPFTQRSIEHPKTKVQEFLGADIERFENHYTLSSATSQISTTLWTPKKSINIYGDWRKPFTWDANNDPKWKEIEERERKLWEALPAGLRDCLARIENERGVIGAPWLPENIEVLLWPYEYAPDESILWPLAWPDLKSKTTKRRNDADFSLYLSADLLPDLKLFVSARKETGAVHINGKKMAITYRFPIPGEELWMR